MLCSEFRCYPICLLKRFLRALLFCLLLSHVPLYFHFLFVAYFASSFNCPSPCRFYLSMSHHSLKLIFIFQNQRKKNTSFQYVEHTPRPHARYIVDRCSMMWNFQTYRTTNFLSVQTDCIFIAFLLLHVYHIKFISFILILNAFLFSECYSCISIAESYKRRRSKKKPNRSQTEIR